MFNDLRRAVIVRFVDIGDNGDHQNLNCFYHTLIRKTKKENQRIYYDISEPWNIGHYRKWYFKMHGRYFVILQWCSYEGLNCSDNTMLNTRSYRHKNT